MQSPQTMSDVTALSLGRPDVGTLGRALVWLRRFARQQPLATVGGVLILALVVVAVFAPSLAPYGENEVNILHPRENSSRAFPFGTDELGRDLFSRVILGARISVAVGFGATAIAVALAVLIGALSGYFRGKLDLVIQRVVDAVMSVPTLISLMAIITVTGPGLRQVIVVLGVFSSIGASRVIRSVVLSLREQVFIEAAQVIGASPARIIIRHILPNVVPLVLVLASTLVGAMVLAEGALSFLGIGVPPPNPSWGGMLSQGRTIMARHPIVVLWPGLFLALFVFGWNMLGDGLRDVLDPRQRGARG